MNSSSFYLEQIVGIIFGVLLLLTTAQAASFDCGKASSEVEKLICGNRELSMLDESLNKAYLRALKRPDIRKQMIESQGQWLKNERDSCKNAECLKKAYETRIKELGLSSYGIVIEGPPKPTASPSKSPPEASESRPTESAGRTIETEPWQQHEPTTGLKAESGTIKTQKGNPADDNEEDEDIYRSLTMKCDYSDYKTWQYESVSIEQTTENTGRPAGVKTFKRGSGRRELVCE